MSYPTTTWHLGRRAVSAAAVLALAATGLVALAASPAQAAPPTPPYLDDSGVYSFEERAADLVSRLTRAEKLTQFTASTSRTSASPIPRLGVAGYGYWNEALHGIARAGEATAFPTGLGIGSTWNRDLVYRMTDAASDEARTKWYSNQVVGLTFWSPTINMNRDPRWGRAEETYGEDPYLTGQLAAEFVDGLQSNDGTYLKAVATAKHFAANNHENSRHADSSTMPEHTLREYYLPAFQVLAEEHDLGSLMTSYNSVNGVPAPANQHLVDELLRRTWGFHGFITSDCGAIYDVGGSGHHWTPEGADHQVTRVEATAYSLKAGTDVDCTGEQYAANLGPAIDQGLLTEADLDVALVRVFTERMRLGEFDATNPWPSSQYTVAKEISAPDHLQTAEEMSEEALVLLKNEPAAGQNTPILPLSQNADDIDNIVVVGQRAGQWELGDYSPHSVAPADNGINTPLYGIRQAVTALGGDGDVNVTFVGNNNSGTLNGSALSQIAAADAVIVVIGTIGSDSAEERDRDTLDFPRGQAGFVTQAIAANPRTVVYVTSVAQMNIESFRDDVPAILWSTYNGQRQGTALGKVLWGIDGTNPSAHLPFTWYGAESQIPNIKDYTLAPHDGGYGRTYQFFSGSVSYPFGFGLSYSTFTYSNVTLDRSTISPDGTVTASVKVTNTSGPGGQAVVQLYATSPDADGQARPVSRLIGFEKIRLGPSQSRVVTFPVEVADLWFWDDDAGQAVIDTGTWTLYAGGHADDDAASVSLNVTGSWTKTLKTVRAIPSGHVIDMSVPGSAIDAGASAVANDQTFYNLDDIDVTYTSSNPRVATVSWRGKVSGVSDGVATITVTATAGGVTQSDTFPVVVTHTPPVLDSIDLDAVSLPGFDPAVESYTHPALGPTFPAVTASAEAGLTIEIDQATAATRTATVTVTDAAGGYRVYSIRFTYPFETFSFASSPPRSEAELAAHGWTMVRPTDAAWRTTTTGLEIDTAFGDYHQASSNPPRNVLTHDAPGDWIATVKVTPHGQINQNYQQGLIGVYQDDDNYVKVAMQNGGLVFVTESGASTTQVGPNRNVGAGNPTPPVWLRITKIGDQYSGYYSLNGTVFYRMGNPGTLRLNEPKFIVTAINGEQNPPSVPIEFDGVTVTPVSTSATLNAIDFAGIVDESDLNAHGWSFVRSTPAAVTYGASAATGASGVTIAQASGELHEAQTPDAVNILTHDAPGDWVATAELHLSDAPDGNWQKNLMALYEDDDNFADILYQWDGGLNLEFSTEGGGRRDMNEARDRVALSTPVTDLWLRLTRVGQTVAASYSTVGASGPFTALGVSKTFIATTAKLALGTYAGTGKSTTFARLDVSSYVPPPVIALEPYDFRGKDATDLASGHWTWLNPNPAAVTYGTGGLDVQTSSAGLWQNNTSDNPDNILLHPAPGDWMATIELEATDLNDNYEQVVLGVYGDSNNYIKLVRSAENGGVFQYAQETNGSGDLGSAVATGATHVWLRLLKIGDTYQAFTSTDGIDFTQLGWAFTKTFTDPRLMLATYKDAGGAASASVRYIDLKVTPPPSDTVTAFDFPDREIDLTDTRAGVQLAGTWTTSGDEHGTGTYLILPSSTNTAGGHVTPAGILTAQTTGTVDVTVEVKVGLVVCRGTAKIRVIPDGTGSLTSLTPPAWDLTTASAHIGTAITVTEGTWSVTPAAVTYQWFADGAPIAGETGTSYAPVASDLGTALTVAATASHSDYPPVTVAVGPVEVRAASANKTALRGQADAAGALVDRSTASDYTATSWATLQGALAEALRVLADDDATQAQVTAAGTALGAATLIRRADLTGLVATIGAFDALSVHAGLYTASSWAALEAWIDQARALAAAPADVVDADVAPVRIGIDAAWADLETTPDTATLAALAVGIDAMITDGRLVAAGYTSTTWTALTSALSTAAALVAAPTTQNAVDGAEAALRAAVAGLAPVVHTGALSDVVGLVEDLLAGGRLDQDAYTADSWAALLGALTLARGEVATPTSQTAADAAADALRGALVDLELGSGGTPAAPSTAALTDLAQAAENLVASQRSQLTAASAAALAAAIAQAKDVLAMPASERSQDEIDRALGSLRAAIGGATPKSPDTPAEPAASRDALRQLVASVQHLPASAFTPATLATLTAAAAAGQLVLANPNATSAEIDAALRALTGAVAGLVLAPAQAGPGPGDTGQAPLTDPPTVMRVKAAQKSITLVKGKKATVAAYGYTATGTVKVTWKSSNSTVAAVSAAGKITAKKVGKATMSVKAGTHTATFSVRVVAKNPAIKVKTVKASVPRTLAVGATKAITGTFAPAGAVGVKVTYTSSKPQVAIVDKAGMVTAKAPGTTTIAVKAGGKTKTYTVTVR